MEIDGLVIGSRRNGR